MTNKTLAEAFGDFVRRTRKAKRITMDMLAVEVNRYGLRWDTSKITRMEAGTPYAIPVSTLILCTKALGALCGEKLSITAFLDGMNAASRLQIDEQCNMSVEELRLILNGRPIEFDSSITLSDLPSEIQQILIEDSKHPEPPTLAEKRAVKKLGVSLESLREAAMQLYSDTIEGEAAYRAGEGASAQKRGYEMREILNEIEEYLEESNDAHISVKTEDSSHENDPQWIADHLADYDFAAKRGDTETERQAYEDMP